MLFVRGFATPEEVRDAASRGDEEAIAELPGLGRREKWLERAKHFELNADSELPELEGDALDFVWDFEEAEGERWTVIRAAGEIVWRELAYWEGQDRFIAVRDLLTARYGSVFGQLTPSTAAKLYLYGDERSRI